jgi:segregation and condensation protein A
MSYEIKLEVFEGPLDLLLHLIHRNEVSITDIPVALIASQYLETVALMQSLNLDVAGEYLVMAAYLTHIKSQMLLPPSEDEGEPADAGRDPREELVAHLLEYKRYKDAAENLSALTILDRDSFVRESEEGAEPSIGNKAGEPLAVSLHELLDALRAVLDRTGRRDLMELEPERLHVKDKLHMILQRLEHDPEIAFSDLFGQDISRLNVLTTFLALLELVKLQLVRVYQDSPFGTILVSSRCDTSGRTREPEESPTGEDSSV